MSFLRASISCIPISSVRIYFKNFCNRYLGNCGTFISYTVIFREFLKNSVWDSDFFCKWLSKLVFAGVRLMCNKKPKYHSLLYVWCTHYIKVNSNSHSFSSEYISEHHTVWELSTGIMNMHFIIQTFVTIHSRIFKTVSFKIILLSNFKWGFCCFSFPNQDARFLCTKS